MSPKYRKLATGSDFSNLIWLHPYNIFINNCYTAAYTIISLLTGSIEAPQKDQNIVPRNFPRRPHRPPVHCHVDPLHPLPLAHHRKLTKHLHCFVVPQHPVFTLVVVHYLIPPDHEGLVSLVHITEIVDPEPLEVLLQIGPFLLAVLVLALLPYFLEHIVGVEILPLLLLVGLPEFGKYVHQPLPDPVLRIDPEEVLPLPLLPRIHLHLPLPLLVKHSHHLLRKLVPADPDIIFVHHFQMQHIEQVVFIGHPADHTLGFFLPRGFAIIGHVWNSAQVEHVGRPPVAVANHRQYRFQKGFLHNGGIRRFFLHQLSLLLFFYNWLSLRKAHLKGSYHIKIALD